MLKRWSLAESCHSCTSPVWPWWLSPGSSVIQEQKWVLGGQHLLLLGLHSFLKGRSVLCKEVRDG